MILSKLLMCLSVLLLGADARIKAPDSAPVGQFVLVDGSDSVGSVTWECRDKDVSVFTSQDGKQIVLRCPATKTVKVRLTASDAAGKSADVALIDFGGDPNPPGPMPDPFGPTPLPDGRYKIAQHVCDEGCKVQSHARKAEAVQLAAKLADIRKRVQSGEIDTKDPSRLMGEIQKANGQLPADVRARWSAWGSSWGKRLYECWRAGQVATAGDWCVILDETILGLKAVM